jgi:drug/metabolite transporter (DMT)-like permease
MSPPTRSSQDRSRRPRRHAAGLFDIRNIIGALLAIYGVVLLLLAIFGSPGNAVEDRGANLWMGIALLVAGAFFLVWARMRPIVVDEAALEREQAEGEDGSTMPS